MITIIKKKIPIEFRRYSEFQIIDTSFKRNLLAAIWISWIYYNSQTEWHKIRNESTNINQQTQSVLNEQYSKTHQKKKTLNSKEITHDELVDSYSVLNFYYNFVHQLIVICKWAKSQIWNPVSIRPSNS